MASTTIQKVSMALDYVFFTFVAISTVKGGNVAYKKAIADPSGPNVFKRTTEGCINGVLTGVSGTVSWGCIRTAQLLNRFGIELDLAKENSE